MPEVGGGDGHERVDATLPGRPARGRAAEDPHGPAAGLHQLNAALFGDLIDTGKAQVENVLAVAIIKTAWTHDTFSYKGKYWTVNKPDVMFDFLKPHLKPVQAPHPPIGVAGLSKGSDTLNVALGSWCRAGS